MSEYIPLTPQWFDVRKAAQVAAFFAYRAGGKINIVKLMKLMYLADRQSLDERDFSITGDNYASMKLGPMLEHTYDLAKGKAVNRRKEWDELIAPRRGNLIPLAREFAEEDTEELSRADLRILEEVWSKFKDMDQWELADWAHKFCPEWRDPGQSSIPIAYGTIGKRLGKEDPTALEEQLSEDRRLAVTIFAH
jgi:uncharacterized phage-associated protein